MDLHGQIMNLPTPAIVETLPYGRRMAYKTAHRDARHAAAELALKADACIEALRAIVKSAELNHAAVNTFLLIDARDALAAVR